MTFTPRVIHDDEALPLQTFGDKEADLVLPEELAALAAQLTQDAHALAERYPATSSGSVGTSPLPRDTAAPLGEQQEGPPLRRKDSLAWRAAVAILAVAGITGATTAWLQVGAPSHNAHTAHPVATPQDAAPHKVEPVQNVVFRPFEQETLSSQDVSPDELAPASATFLHDLTGPELEGFLDLLEADNAASMRLSI